MVLLLLGAVGMVAYTFAGYPAAVAVLGRWRPRPPAVDPGHVPSTTLIVLAYDEADTIESKLQDVARLDYPRDRLEVLVVADGSTDATAELARTFEGVVVLHDPHRGGKLAAMLRGAAAATGEVLVFSDANNRYTPNALRHLVAPFADPQVGMVTGRKVIDDGSGRPLDRAEGLYWRYESRIREWETRVGSVTGVCGEAVAFRRDAFPALPPGTMNEDFVQAMLVAADGWRVVYAPGAVSIERASATLAGEATRRSRLVTGRLQALTMVLPRIARRDRQLLWQVVSHKGLRPLVTPALLATLVSDASLARRRGWARLLLACQAIFYLLAVLGWHGERRGRRSRLAYLPYWFCRMNGASLHGIHDFARNRREAVWAKVERA